jgi:hypothetical protein
MLHLVYAKIDGAFGYASHCNLEAVRESIAGFQGKVEPDAANLALQATNTTSPRGLVKGKLNYYLTALLNAMNLHRVSSCVLLGAICLSTVSHAHSHLEPPGLRS